MKKLSLTESGLAFQKSPSRKINELLQLLSDMGVYTRCQHWVNTISEQQAEFILSKISGVNFRICNQFRDMLVIFDAENIDQCKEIINLTLKWDCEFWSLENTTEKNIEGLPWDGEISVADFKSLFSKNYIIARQC